jgi:cyclopropane-fatty-acyl-phospholipid synthase
VAEERFPSFLYCPKDFLPVKHHFQKLSICICTQERMKAKEKVREILALADIELDGPDPWDIQIHDERFYQRVLSHGSMGLGDSYMDGWWDVLQLDEFFCKIQKAGLHDKVKTFSVVWLAAKGRLLNRQTK